MSAWQAWGLDSEPSGGPIYDVDIYTNYGFGSTWRGRAERDYLVEGWDRLSEPDGDDVVRGRVEWATAALIAETGGDYRPPITDPD